MCRRRLTGRIMLWIPLVVMTLASRALAVVPDFGACPAVKTVENFDIQRYIGKWYEAERYFSIMSVGTKCCTSNYTMNEDGALSVIASHTSTISRADSNAVGRVEPIGKSSEPKLNVRWDSLGFPYTTSYTVLATDYGNYSVEWSCVNVGLLSFKSAWIMTRQRTPSVSVLENAYQVLDRNQISRAYLFRTDQKNCPEDH